MATFWTGFADRGEYVIVLARSPSSPEANHAVSPHCVARTRRQSACFSSATSSASRRGRRPNQRWRAHHLRPISQQAPLALEKGRGASLPILQLRANNLRAPERGPGAGSQKRLQDSFLTHCSCLKRGPEMGRVFFCGSNFQFLPV